MYKKLKKLFPGGGYWFFSVQCIAIISLTLLGLIGGYLIIWITNKILPIRLDALSEEKGCDLAEHGILDVSMCSYPYPLVDEIKLSNVKFDDVNIHIPYNFNRQFSSDSMRLRQGNNLNTLFDHNDSVQSSPRLTPRTS